MGKQTNVKVKDFTTEEELEKLNKLDEDENYTFDPDVGIREMTQEEIEERDRERERREKEAEEKRIREEKEREENRKIQIAINKKKQRQNPPPFKPSRLIDVDSDVAIMNIETMVTSIKESVEFIENKLWEIEGYLYRKDKKKRESLKIKKLKRKGKKQ